MPEEFDPEWEYFAGDEEVEEIVNAEYLDKLRVWDAFASTPEGLSPGWSTFKRKGSNDPETRKVKFPKMHRNACAGCGREFAHPCKFRRCCSAACVTAFRDECRPHSDRAGEFIRLWVLGVPLPHIEVSLRASEITLVKWKKKYALPNRR